jgi:hypothetical protein
VLLIRQGKEFSFLHVVKIGSGVHPASYPMGTGGSFPEVKWEGREADNLPASSAQDKNGGVIPTLPHIFFKA